MLTASESWDLTVKLVYMFALLPQATNPYGNKYGTIPAVIFRYFANNTSGFAVCGNNLYAQVRISAVCRQVKL
jgi:hypothetical protein